MKWTEFGYVCLHTGTLDMIGRVSVLLERGHQTPACISQGCLVMWNSLRSVSGEVEGAETGCTLRERITSGIVDGGEVVKQVLL